MQRKKSILFIGTLLCIILLSFTRHTVSAEEVTPTQAPAVNDVYDYENEGQTLSYRLLNLPSETEPGTAEVAGIKSIPDQIRSVCSHGFQVFRFLYPSLPNIVLV